MGGYQTLDEFWWSQFLCKNCNMTTCVIFSANHYLATFNTYPQRFNRVRLGDVTRLYYSMNLYTHQTHSQFFKQAFQRLRLKKRTRCPQFTAPNAISITDVIRPDLTRIIEKKIY